MIHKTAAYHSSSTAIAIMLALLLLPSISQAQSMKGYVTAGAIASQIEGDELKGYGHWGFFGGVGTAISLDRNGTWSLTIETDYSTRGVHNNLHNSENYYNIDMDLHYADIPVTLFFRDPYGGMKIGFGPVFSRLVAQPSGTIKFNPTYLIPDTSDMKFLKNDIALAGELRFNIWKGLQFSLRYQYSLIPIKRDWHFMIYDNTIKDTKVWSVNNCYNQAVTFRLIWQFGEPEKFTPRTDKRRKNTYQPQPNIRINRR